MKSKGYCSAFSSVKKRRLLKDDLILKILIIDNIAHINITSFKICVSV